MKKPNIAKKGPYIMDMKPATYYWCACGKSKNQPFCDGSHKGTNFEPKAVSIDTEKRVAWCGCKHSGNAPTCDGTHNKL